MDLLSIGQIEAAINRARSALPSTGHEAALSMDVALLADVYGLMIYQRLDEIRLAELDDEHRAVALRWCPPLGAFAGAALANSDLPPPP